MDEENLVFRALKCSEVKDFHETDNLHHGWRKFWFSEFWECSSVKDFHKDFSDYFHHGWRKFWFSELWNSLERGSFTNNFTMVEGNFEFQRSEMLQSEIYGILEFTQYIFQKRGISCIFFSTRGCSSISCIFQYIPSLATLQIQRWCLRIGNPTLRTWKE